MGTVRISETSRESLREIASREGASMQTVLDRAIESYRRKVFLEGLNTDFQTLRGDANAWKEETEERELWDRALGDGLTEE